MLVCVPLIKGGTFLFRKFIFWVKKFFATPYSYPMIVLVFKDIIERPKPSATD